MGQLVKNPQIKLMLAKHKLVMKDTFESTSCGWVTTQGEWHKVTVDSNADQSSGLDGTIAVDSFGSYQGGRTGKYVNLDNYSEVSFEHYIQNDKVKGKNKLLFYVDGVVKVEVTGPSPWYRCEPIGLTPGKHYLEFEYIPDGEVMGKKAVVDTITIWESRDINCLITEHTPARPIKGIAENKTLRGYSIYQQMVRSSTMVEFTAMFDGLSYHDFSIHQDEVFYYLDEFGVCYRGILFEPFEPKSKSFKTLFYVDINIKANNPVGVGFC